MHQQIAPCQLTIHADFGTSMTSKPVALLLSNRGVTKSHSRPHVSNDNPYSEAHFKTLKYRQAFPDRFGSIEDSRGTCGDFFDSYNLEHHHSGLGLLTPHDVNYGLAEARLDRRVSRSPRLGAPIPEGFPRGLPAPGLSPSEANKRAPPTTRTSADSTPISPTEVRLIAAADH